MSDHFLSDQPLPGMPTPSIQSATNTNPTSPETDRELAPKQAIIDRFNNKIVRSPGCWFWVGAVSSPDGYGRFTWQENSVQHSMSAHRFALLAAGVSLGVGDVAEHACNEPLCVKVADDHVHRSTQSDNLNYAVRSGRHRGNQPATGSHDRAQRSLRIRAALKDGWDPTAYTRAIMASDDNQPPLF